MRLTLFLTIGWPSGQKQKCAIDGRYRPLSRLKGHIYKLVSNIECGHNFVTKQDIYFYRTVFSFFLKLKLKDISEMASLLLNQLSCFSTAKKSSWEPLKMPLVGPARLNKVSPPSSISLRAGSVVCNSVSVKPQTEIEGLNIAEDVTQVSPISFDF